MDLQEPVRVQDPLSSDPGDSGATAEQTSDSRGIPRPNPWADLTADLTRLWMYLGHYLAARSDTIKARIRLALVRAALGLIAAAVGATALVVAVVLVALGVAHGLAVFLGSLWAGELLAGGGFLILMAGGAWAGVRFLQARSRKRTWRKYERRREEERRAAGRDVAE